MCSLSAPAVSSMDTMATPTPTAGEQHSGDSDSASKATTVATSDWTRGTHPSLLFKREEITFKYTIEEDRELLTTVQKR